jgi:hypothetical protein
LFEFFVLLRVLEALDGPCFYTILGTRIRGQVVGLGVHGHVFDGPLWMGVGCIGEILAICVWMGVVMMETLFFFFRSDHFGDG